MESDSDAEASDDSGVIDLSSPPNHSGSHSGGGGGAGAGAEDIIILSSPDTPKKNKGIRKGSSRGAVRPPSTPNTTAAIRALQSDATLATLFELFDGSVFGGRLKAQVTCKWSKRLLTTGTFS